MAKKERLTADEVEAARRLKVIWLENKDRLGLTQAGLANNYKNRDGESITQGAIGHYLNARTALNARACLIFADALQVSPEDFAPLSVIDELARLTPREVPSEYVEVSYYKRKFAAGAGAEDGGIAEERVMYQRRWLEREGVAPSSLKAIDVTGDSMSPQIRGGDTVLIRTDKTIIENNYIYAFDHGSEQRIKRVHRHSKGMLVLSSDNPDAGGPPEIVTRGDLNDIKIIGLVWHRAGPVA